MKFFYLTLLFVSSCASHSWRDKDIASTGKVFAYQDVSGEYEISREVKLDNGKLASRIQIMAPSGGRGERLLEKTVSVSEIGSIRTKNGRSVAIRPQLSQHTVWLEGKKYFSQLKLNRQKKMLEAILESPDARWNGKKELRVPKGSIFCFYTQLPECLAKSGLLEKADQGPGRRFSFILLWDTWPYHQESFTGFTASPFISGTVSRDSGVKTALSYNVEVNGQTLIIHFSKDLSLARILWTAQGITIVPPGEARADDEM